VGSAFGATSPVKTLSPTLYVDFAMEPGASLIVPDAAAERALYSVDAGFEVDGAAVPPFTMVVLEAGSEPLVRTAGAARLVLIGGTPLGHRFMVWNFVSSSKERIVRAQDDWTAQRFAKVPGETEFIPLPAPRAG
jgi:redox-sensitive bicupin YhaK (pirin superfamily)